MHTNKNFPFLSRSASPYKSSPGMVHSLCMAALLATLLIVQSCKRDPPPSPANIVCIAASLQNGIIAFYPFSNGSLKELEPFLTVTSFL